MSNLTVLSKDEALKLSEKVAAIAKNVLVFNKIEYIETKTFTRDNSIYHIFGVYNEYFNCWNKVTYSPIDKTIDFSTHSICANI